MQCLSAVLQQLPVFSSYQMPTVTHLHHGLRTGTRMASSRVGGGSGVRLRLQELRRLQRLVEWDARMQVHAHFSSLLTLVNLYA